MREFISMLRNEPEARLLVVYTILWFVFVMFIPVPITEFLSLPYSLQRLFIVAISGAFGYLLYKHFNKKLNDWDRLERLKHYKHIELEKTKWTKGMLDALPIEPESFYSKDGKWSYDEFYENISREERIKMNDLARKKSRKSKSYFEPQIPLFDWSDIEDFFDWNGLPAATFSPIEGGINGWFVNESGVWKEASAIEIARTGKVISKGKFRESFLETLNNSLPFEWNEVTYYYWHLESPVVIIESADSTKALCLSDRLNNGWMEDDLDEVLSKGEKISETTFFEKFRLYERISHKEYYAKAESERIKNNKASGWSDSDWDDWDDKD
jgi:hypothetical protein